MTASGPARTPATRRGGGGPASGSTSKLRKSGAVAGVLFAVLYLLNPTGGFIEFLPDNLPFVGNLDEVGITGLLIYSLRVLGVEVIPRGPGSRRAD